MSEMGYHEPLTIHMPVPGLFWYLRGMGATIQKWENGTLSIGVNEGGAHTIDFHEWPSRDALSEVIRWAREAPMVPESFVVDLTPDEAQTMFSNMDMVEMAAIRNQRPLDAPAGWVFAVDGVDIVVARSAPVK
jgi:hypothetical protein